MFLQLGSLAWAAIILAAGIRGLARALSLCPPHMHPRPAESHDLLRWNRCGSPCRRATLGWFARWWWQSPSMPRDTAYRDLRPPALTLRAASGVFHAVPLSMPSRCTFVLRRICRWRRRCCWRGVTRPHRHFACPRFCYMARAWVDVRDALLQACPDSACGVGRPLTISCLGTAFGEEPRRMRPSDAPVRAAVILGQLR
jgi:hypothetical protein